ncbi:hypothetical protein Syn7502_00838 [Synechococcus sp. PCC 7502]|nr:hypothetical protein Syn7502_00838 [Synechococcus sp. PCC 7502]
MKPINHYTTISEYTEQVINNLDRSQKISLMFWILSKLVIVSEASGFYLLSKSKIEIQELSLNESLGLIKALADQCQETLISK